MPTTNANPGTPARRHSRRWPVGTALLVVAGAIALLVVPALAGVPARLVGGCAKWIAAAGVLELLSAFGFVLVFNLVFAAPIGWRRTAPAALRALGASTILPGGGLIGPTVGAWSAGAERSSLSQMTRSTVTFVILTNTPGAIVLAVLGVLLWLGLPGGPHQPALTMLPALLAVGLLTMTWLAGHTFRSHSLPRRRILWRPLARFGGALSDGAREAHGLVSAGNWKLVGALGYYALDNAVLWAAFHAYGRVPPLGVVVMGYLVGSLAAALPLPAGLGAVEGGLIGALVLYGAPATSAAAAVLLYRGVSLSLPVALGALGWTCGTRLSRAHRGPGQRAACVDPPLTKRRPAAELLAAHTE